MARLLISISEPFHRVMGWVYRSRMRKLARWAHLSWLVGALQRLFGGRAPVVMTTFPGKVVIEVPPYDATFVGSEADLPDARTLKSESRLIKRFISLLRPTDVVWDVGANIGLYTILVARAIGESGVIVAFEPEERTFIRLQENVTANTLKNVMLVESALGDRDGRIQLVPGPEPQSGVHTALGLDAPGDAQWVTLRTGDNLIASDTQIRLPQALKIDVEGMELDVLLGLQRTLAAPELRLVLCEVHFSSLEKSGNGAAPDSIVRLLRESGFLRLDWPDASHILAQRR